MKTLILLLTIISSGFFGTTVQKNEVKSELYTISKQNCAVIADNEGMKDPIDSIYELKDLEGNIFYAQIGEENGFMVYDPITQNCIEKSASLKSPYDFTLNKDYYYFGPMNYYERINNTFYSLMIEGEQFSLEYAYELQKIFSEQLSTFRNAQSEISYENYLKRGIKGATPYSITNGNKTYINNYQYIRDAKHPTNYDGSCGFVAASIILNYWDKTMHKGTVLPQFLDTNGDLNDTSAYDPNTNLKDKLVELNGGKGNEDSWGKVVRDSMISYCEYANLAASSAYYFGKIGLDNELSNNRPAIIFGALPDYPDSNLITHAVTAYGIQKEWWGGYYIVNYGWGSSSAEVSLGFGFVGSVTLFELNSDTYSRDYLVQPDDYGFADSYVTNPTTKTVNTAEVSFDTNRLRCGYTQQEYINLCPRKAGYGTAYLEYYFKNPVYKIDVNLSFWSDDERYGGANVAEARIEYQRLCENSFISALDLLSANLPTDRKNQKTYTISFPGGTRYFRFYTHFDYMSGFTDRNKGRISIGDMRIYTYR